MLKITHTKFNPYYKSLSTLNLENGTLLVDRNEVGFLYVKPTDVNQTFGAWKNNIPTFTYKKVMNVVNTFKTLSSAYTQYDSTAIFNTPTLAKRFMLGVVSQWQKRIGGTSDDSGTAIAVDGSGNVYLNGYQTSSTIGYTDYGVVKLDPDGNLLWQKRIGGKGSLYGLAIAVDGSGNVYLNGYQNSSTTGLYDYGVVKLDTDGNLLWRKRIGGTGNDCGNAIAVDGSGNVYLNGYQNSSTVGVNDYGVVKLDPDGNLLWQKRIGGADSDYGTAIAVDGSGNVYLNGYQYSSTAGIHDYGVVKLDPDGNLLWQKRIGGTGDDSGTAIAVDGSGNVYLNGYQTSSTAGGLYDYGVVKLDPDGNLLWQKRIGGTGDDYGMAIAVDGSGNVYLNGYQSSSTAGGLYDYGVVKLDPDGNLLWQKRIGGTGDDYGMAIAVDGSGNVYLNGYQTSSTAGNYDYGVIKLSGTQTSDMNLSIDDMNLIIADSNLTIASMSGISISDATNFSIAPMNLTISDSTLSGVDSIGGGGGLQYIGD